MDLRANIWANTVLTGRGCNYPGLAHGLQKDLQGFMPASHIAKNVSPPEKKHAAWLGSKLLFANAGGYIRFIPGEECRTEGPDIVHRSLRCNRKDSS